MTNTSVAEQVATPVSGRSAALQIEALFCAIRDERVAAEESIFSSGQASYEWSDPEVGRRFIAVLRTASCHAATFADGTTVVSASVADTPDGFLWSYVTCELLDSAAAWVDLAAVAVAEPEIREHRRGGTLHF